MLAIVIAFIGGILVNEAIEHPYAIETSYQPYHEETIKIIVSNENKWPMDGFYITETDYTIWSDNQLQNYKNRDYVYKGQALVIEGMPCGWDMSYDLKATFFNVNKAELRGLDSVIRHSVPAPCGIPIWWKIE